mgnify:CR=1 FL=1
MAQQVIAEPVTHELSTRRPSKNPASRSWAPAAVLVVALVFFFIPWVCAAIFGFTRPGEGVTAAPLVESLQNPRAGGAIANTLLLTAATTVLMLVLLVPTVVYVNLYSPRMARVAEALSVLPLVVPAVALVSGVSEFYRVIAPAFLNSMWSLVPLYVVLALPLCYRVIDAGVKALDLRTLVAASTSLGATARTTMFSVIVPNLKVAMLSAALLCVALCLSEYAMASLLLHYTFPVFLVEVGAVQPRGIAALSFITLLVTWALLASISSFAKTGRASRRKKDK